MGDGARPDQALGHLTEVLRPDRCLEPDDVGTEQALDQLDPPRDTEEQLLRRERDVEEEPDPQIGAEPAEHGRDEVQLVVVDPHGRSVGGDLGGGLGEPLVDLGIPVPPGLVELGHEDRIVVEGPQRAVREPAVERVRLRLVEPDRVEDELPVDER